MVTRRGALPLDALQHFVAVGRRLSMKQAASELCVTPAAVSKQIAKLEAYLKTSLLIRGSHGLALTPAGIELLEQASDGLDRIVRAMRDASEDGMQRPVHISASVGVTGLWLVPKMTLLQVTHPEIDVSISADNSVTPLRGSRFDLAIRYCPPEEAPKGAARLFGETVAPVASPALALVSLLNESIGKQVLLDFDDVEHPWLTWTPWLQSHGITHHGGLKSFNQYDQLIQAALAGQGVALGRLQLIGEHLESGRLQIVGHAVKNAPSEYAYWLLSAEEHPRGSVRQVADWIRTQASQQPT